MLKHSKITVWIRSRNRFSTLKYIFILYLLIDCFDTDNLYKTSDDIYICFGNCTSIAQDPEDQYSLCQDPEAINPENFIKASGNVSIV